MAEARAAFSNGLEAQRARVVELCRRLAATDSQNPPGDTGAIAQVCYDALAEVPGVEVRKVVAKAPMTNIVGRIAGGRPGRRLVFNGHLDTGSVADPSQWTVPPFGGVVRDGRIYGRGVCDMKAGLTAGIMALAMLALVREQFSGEFVVTLVADEGSGAQWGTTYLLENEKAGARRRHAERRCWLAARRLLRREGLSLARGPGGGKIGWRRAYLSRH